MALQNIDQNVIRAFDQAIKAQTNSYSPYSKFPVGAAVKFSKSDQIFTGTNVENLSFGATICAERSAICSGIAKNSKDTIEFIIVIGPDMEPISPCGLCLQVINEFATKKTHIYLANKDGIQSRHKLEDFLKNPFTTTSL